MKRDVGTEAPPLRVQTIAPDVVVKPPPPRRVATPPPPVVPAPETKVPRAIAEPANNSGTGGPVPREVLDMGYCWPGVLFKSFWLGAHSIPLSWQARTAAGGSLTGWGTTSWLGEHGYALAWQHRRFSSLREFQDSMKVWQTWAKAVPGIVGIIIGARMLGGFVSAIIDAHNYPQ